MFESFMKTHGSVVRSERHTAHASCFCEHARSVTTVARITLWSYAWQCGTINTTYCTCIYLCEHARNVTTIARITLWSDAWQCGTISTTYSTCIYLCEHARNHNHGASVF